MKQTPTTTLEQALLENTNLRQQVVHLQEQLQWFQRQIFGQRSEKIIAEPTYNFLPGLSPQDSPVEDKKQVVASHTRVVKNKTDPNKLSFPEDLPKEQIIIDLKEEDKICPETGKPLVKIGEDITQKLAHRPGSFYIKEIIRLKYASPQNGKGTVHSAPLPESLLSKCKVDDSFLADILVKKFADHLPLYRQSEMLSREGICVSRQLLSKWVVKCGFALKPIFDEMYKLVLASNNVFIDEVPVDMLNPGQGKVHPAYMWVLVGGTGADPPYRIFNFRTDRSHAHAASLIKDYNGVLHSDKYGAYETLATKKQFTWCPCWAHIRRKFFEAQSGDAEFRDFVLGKIGDLFMLERDAWNQSDQQRLQIRQIQEVAIIDELITLIKEKLVYGNVLPKSKFREALGYFCGLIPFLKNYTQHAYARLDNNIAERAVRPLAIGRKNWLFLGSEEGGEAAGIILSIIQSCRALKINPRIYMEDIMRRLMSHNSSQVVDLLPHNWLKSQTSQ